MPSPQAPGSSLLVQPLQAQAGIYLATGTWFSEIPTRGIPALMSCSFTLVSPRPYGAQSLWRRRTPIRVLSPASHPFDLSLGISPDHQHSFSTLSSSHMVFTLRMSDLLLHREAKDCNRWFLCFLPLIPCSLFFPTIFITMEEKLLFLLEAGLEFCF